MTARMTPATWMCGWLRTGARRSTRTGSEPGGARLGRPFGPVGLVALAPHSARELRAVRPAGAVPARVLLVAPGHAFSGSAGHGTSLSRQQGQSSPSGQDLTAGERVTV